MRILFPLTAIFLLGACESMPGRATAPGIQTGTPDPLSVDAGDADPTGPVQDRQQIPMN